MFFFRFGEKPILLILYPLELGMSFNFMIDIFELPLVFELPPALAGGIIIICFNRLER